MKRRGSAILASVFALSLIQCGDTATSGRPAQTGGSAGSGGSAGTGASGGSTSGGAAGSGATAGAAGSGGGTSGSGGASGGGGASGSAGTVACPTFSDGADVGAVANDKLDEISGLVASRKNDGILWAHNDSGDKARFYAVGTDGAERGRYELDGAGSDDYEDIAIGPGPTSGKSYLYIGDIGDNPESRPDIVVYRVEEPTVPATGTPPDEDITAFDTLTFTYPDGSNNSETLLVEPKSGDLYVLTKKFSGTTGVYKAAAPHMDGSNRVLESVGTLQFGQAPLDGTTLLTGGDISADGREILLRTYNRVFLFRRGADQTVQSALGGMPCPMPAATETQGEAIAFSVTGDAYFTASEGSNPPLFRYARQ